MKEVYIIGNTDLIRKGLSQGCLGDQNMFLAGRMITKKFGSPLVSFKNIECPLASS